MADNIELNAGTGGAILATDDVASVHHQLVKLEYGADGAAAMVSASNPLPVDLVGNLTPKRAKISCAASGDNTLVAAVSGKRIRVLSIALIATDAVEVYFKSAGGTAIFADGTSPVPLDKAGASGPAGMVLNFNPVGWLQTDVADEALEVNLSAAVGVCGALTYVEVD
ncbi:MAG: hypothetical protein A2V70_08435 [Planctomycetes bacterium RBG_13_63_9]|nr:MAG: hypothetical protein A2V70_08435 [Planctomycetes bacterium RBG_13_63_9]